MLSVLLLSVSLFAGCGTRNCRKLCKSDFHQFVVSGADHDGDLLEDYLEDCEDLPRWGTCEDCLDEIHEWFYDYHFTITGDGDCSDL